jgi:hypothetical protein
MSEEILASSDLVARQNEVLRQINEAPKGEDLSNSDAQLQAIARSDQRCPRCGELTWSIIPTLSFAQLCAPCMSTLRALDAEFDSGIKWFSQLVFDSAN